MQIKINAIVLLWLFYQIKSFPFDDDSCLSRCRGGRWIHSKGAWLPSPKWWQQQMLNDAGPLVVLWEVLAITSYFKIRDRMQWKSLHLFRDKTKNTAITVRTAPDKENQIHTACKCIRSQHLQLQQEDHSVFPFSVYKEQKKPKLMQRLRPNYSLLTHKKVVSCTILVSFVMADKMRSASLKQNYWLSEGL